MREKQLDARLAAALDLFPRVRVGADIGADHGYLTLALLENDIAQRMWATDISALSLKKAERLMALNGCSSRVLFGVGDGFKPLGEKPEAAAVLGMGGVTIRNMLRTQRELFDGCALVLSANTEMPSVRRALQDIGYRIEREVMTEAAGRFYPVLLAAPGQGERYSEKQLTLGPCLLAQPITETYRRWLVKKKADWQAVRGERGACLRRWIEEEMARD